MARKWLKHAFAVDPPGPADPTAEQKPVVEWACREIARRRLSTPGLLFLEMSRPLNYVAAQTMHFFQPAFWAILRKQSVESYRHFSEFLERRGSLEYIIQRIEELEDEAERSERRAGTTGVTDPASASPAGPEAARPTE